MGKSGIVRLSNTAKLTAELGGEFGPPSLSRDPSGHKQRKTESFSLKQFQALLFAQPMADPQKSIPS